MKEKAFIISRESVSFVVKDQYENIDIITVMKTDTETLILLRKKIDPTPAKFIQIKESDEEFLWIDEVRISRYLSNMIYVKYIIYIIVEI